MLYMSCTLVVVVRSILCSQTRPLPIASLWSTATHVAAPIPLYAPGAHKISLIELCIGTKRVPMPFMFSIIPTGRGHNKPSA